MQSWNDELYQAAQNFYERFLIYPNVLLSNPFTQSQIDRIANSEKENHLFDSAGEAPDDDSEVRFSSFCRESFEIDFCYDTSIDHPEFYLIFGEEYDGGDEDNDCAPEDPVNIQAAFDSETAWIKG